ncbi:hypothetical protein ACFV7R_41695 [Streptomyces sp. NPDC059866]
MHSGDAVLRTVAISNFTGENRRPLTWIASECVPGRIVWFVEEMT